MTQEKSVILMIVDISGYTKFMLANKTSLIHAQQIISSLMQAIIKEINLPMKIAKFEGDAIFIYALKDKNAKTWTLHKQQINQKLPFFFHRFKEKLEEMKKTINCPCGACSNVQGLKLKVIVHSGVALFYKLANFSELAGIDVIILHRLLKNSINRHEYILITEAAHLDITLQGEKPLRGSEYYDDVGKINAYVYLPKVLE